MLSMHANKSIIRRDEGESKSKQRVRFNESEKMRSMQNKLSQGFILRHELDKEELEKATYIKFERRSRI